MDQSWTPAPEFQPGAAIGDPHEVAQFLIQWPGVAQELAQVLDLTNAALNRHWTGNNREDLVIFALGHQIFECFEDIQILAANGRGFGATKLLRAMYEHLVAGTYIHKNPDQAEPYMKYENLRNEQLVPQIAGALDDGRQKADLKARMPDLKAKADAVRHMFIRACKCHPTCDKTLPAMSWTTLGMAAMAREAGLSGDLLQSYYVPITETHPTFSGAVSRMTEESGGGASMSNSALQSRRAGYRAFAMAWKHALQNIDLQIDHFPALAGLRPQLDARIAKYTEILKQEPEEPKTAPEDGSAEIQTA